MLKCKKIMTLLATFFLVNIVAVNADVTYKSADSAIGSSTVGTKNGGCTVPQGTRQGTNQPYGYRISLLEKTSDNGAKTIAIYDRMFVNNGCEKIDSTKNKLGDLAPYQCYDPTRYSTVDSIAFSSPKSKGAGIDYSDVKVSIEETLNDSVELIKGLKNDELLNAWKGTTYYKKVLALAKVANQKKLYECSKKNCSITNNPEAVQEYLNLIGRTYIMVEPIITIRLGASEAYYNGNRVCEKSNDVELTSCNTIECFLKYLGLVFDKKDSTKSDYSDVICTGDNNDGNYMKSCHEGAGKSYFDMLELLKEILSNIKQYTYYTDTVTNLAKKDYSNDNLVRSVMFNALSVYLKGSEGVTTFPYFKSGTPKDYSDVNPEMTINEGKSYLKNNDYAYGLNIIHLDFTRDQLSDKCFYTEEMARKNEPVGGPLYLVARPDYCCLESEKWIDYDATKPVGQRSIDWKRWVNSSKFKAMYIDTGICAENIDSCGKEQYDAIAAGKSLDTPITFVTRKNGNETTTTTTLRACCDWDAYNDPNGSHTLTGKITKEQFDKTKKEFCEVCSINEYNAIVNDGEANPDTRPVSILTKLSPVFVNGVQQKYQYCCDSYDNYGENQLPKKITKANFDSEFKEKYCVNPDRKCGEAEFNKLVKYNKKVLDGSLKESALASNDKYKISIGGETVSILVCCNQDEYEPNVAKTLNNKSGIENIFQPAPPNFDATNKKLKLKICQNDTSYCTYDVLRNATKVEDTIVTINGVKRNCCEWDAYGSTDEEKAKNSTYSDATKFQKDHKYLELCSPSCTWNGNSTERLQYVNKEEKDCCYYKNYGAVAKEALAKFKDPANGVDGVKSQKDLEKTGWYKKYCSDSKCSLTKMKTDDKMYKECCDEDIESFNEEDQNKIRPYGGVAQYLIYDNAERYYKVCPNLKEVCNYAVSGSCPDCDSSISAGKTADVVNGEDSTLFTVSDDVLKCIVENELGGPNYDGYLYKDLGSTYCPVLCTQKVEYDYPSKSSFNVQGGRYIPTSTIKPKINTVLTCRINKVDIKQFESDLKAAKAELEAAYEAYSKAKVPLNNNQAKINTKDESGVNGYCDCKNNQTYNSTDGKCCSSTAYVEYTSVTSGILTKSTEGVNPNACQSYSVSATGSVSCTNNCQSYGGVSNYHYNCNGDNAEGSRPDGDPNICKKNNRGVASYSCTCNNCVSYYSCGSGYVASGDECVKYSCADTITVNGETAYLNTSKSSYGATTSPKCYYEYCGTRDYTRYNSQTVQTYNYAVNDSKTQAKQDKKTCENNDDYYEKVYKKEVEQTKKRLSDAKKAYENVIEDFEKCFHVDEEMKTYSDYEVKLNLEYLNGKDGNPYSVSTVLSKSTDVNTANNFEYEKYSFNACELPYDWANGGHGKLQCTTKSIDIFKNAMQKIYSVQATRNFTFTLSDIDVYQYTNKNSFSEKDKNINSVYIGPHLPVAFNENGKEVIVKLKPEFTGSIIKPTFAGELCTDEYVCKGSVSRPCVEPVYRPISLSKPFLDEDGLVRNTGINWCDGGEGGDCSSNNKLVQKVITNNRGETTDQVYKLTPLYTIKLTPSIVKKIRFYNSITTYGDYNLICDEGTGRHCKSVYIRGGAAIDGSNVTNDLTSIGAVDYSRSCALTENLSGCKPGDFYEKR